MQTPTFPADEQQRLEALCELGILDTEPEERFDRFTRILQKIFDVPMALISLVDENRQWFKSHQGLDAKQTPREISFCGHAILGEGVFYIPNAPEDPRFNDNPLVTGPVNIRFYAGAPIATVQGHQVGTLCILDTRPRELSGDQLEVLQDLAQCVANEMNQIKLKETVLELEEQRRYTASILNSVNEGIIAIDKEGVVHSFNPAAERIFGYSEEQVKGSEFKMLVSERHATELGEAMQQFLINPDTGRSGFKREVEGLRSDGSSLPVGLVLGEMVIDGKQMFNGVVRDISTRKKLETMKNEFISTVSHELRTPLSSIKGSLGMIKGGVFGEVPEEIQPMIEIAYSSCDRLVRLVNDMLDLEKIESGQVIQRSVPCDLIQLAEQAMTEIHGFMGDRNIDITLISQVESAMVLGDPDQLTRVITNLLSNAIKFSPPQGQVKIEIDIDQFQVTLKVSDKGPGIPEAFQRDLFERFTQAESSDTKRNGGTGLGLSIAKAIVDTHGGVIDFTSIPHVETCFSFRLPSLNITEDRYSSSIRQPGCILVCESNADSSQLLAELLGGDAELLSAPSITAGKLLLGDRDCDLVIIDLECMEASEEAELTTLARSDGLQIPVIRTSSLRESNDLLGRMAASLSKTSASNYRLAKTLLALMIKSARPSSGKSPSEKLE